MDTVQKVAKNTAVIIVGRVLNLLVSTFVVIYLARYLGSAGLGKYSLIYAYLSFFAFLTTFGMSEIVVREISKDDTRAEELIGSALSLSLFLSIGAIGLAWIVSNFLGYPSNIRLLIYIASLNMLFTPWSLYTSIFQVRLQQKYQVSVEIISKLVLAGLVFVLISMKALLIHFILLNLLVSGIVAMGNRFFSRRFVKPKWHINLRIWADLLKASWPLAISGFFIAIYIRIDQVMLYQMKGDTSVGFYSAAVRLVELLNIIPVAFMTSVLPILSSYFVKAIKSFVNTYELSFKYMLTLIIPVAFIFTKYSKDIVCLVYGEKFLPSYSVLSILIWSEVFVFIGCVHNNILISINKQRVDLLLTGSSCLVNFLLNLLLIPKYSFIGASIATLISYGVGLTIAYFLSVTHQYIKAVIKVSLRPLCASLIMYIVISKFLFNLWISLIFAIGIYGIVLFLIRGIDSTDIRLAKAIIKGEKDRDNRLL